MVVWRSSCGLTDVSSDGSSHGPADDFGSLAVTPVVGVPLLSQEGLTCRLLPGATAPCPALDQALIMVPAAPATIEDCFDLT